MAQSVAGTPTRCSCTSTPSLRALQEGWSPWRDDPGVSCAKYAVNLEDEELASTINSIGVVFEAERDPFRKLVHAPTFHMSASNSSEERTRQFMTTPPDRWMGKGAVESDQPRAGGVQTPGGLSVRRHRNSEMSDGRRSSGVDNFHLHRQASIRMWNHEDESFVPDVVEERAEKYLRSRQRSSLVSHHQSCNSPSSRSIGAVSPQMWRGEAIEEFLTPCQSMTNSGLQNHPTKPAGEDPQVNCSSLTSHHSSASPSTVHNVCVACGSLKVVDGSVNRKTRSSELHLSTTKRLPFSGDKHVVKTSEERGCSSSTAVEFLGRMDALEQRMQHMEEVLLQTMKRFETIQSKMKECMSTLQIHSNSVNLRLEPSLPRGNSNTETREPSHATDA